MTLFKAILMGLIQGVTEFLPVSSSGHLAIFQNLFHINTETGLLFEILLHFGTLIAIFIAYWKDIKELIKEGIQICIDVFVNCIFIIRKYMFGHEIKYRSMKTTSYRRFVILIIISTIPTGIIGVLFQDAIENSMNTFLVPGICLICTGIMLILFNYFCHGNKTIDDTSNEDAIIVGMSQGIATLPGLSRSGTTITACLLCGYEKSYAVKYSFIMSVPAVLGAMVLELKDLKHIQITSVNMTYYIIGTIVAAVVGYICIKTMLVIVKERKFTYFSVYCIMVGIMAVICNFIV